MDEIMNAIRRHPDGSIDYADYNRRARRLRSEEMHSALRRYGLGAPRCPR